MSFTGLFLFSILASIFGKITNTVVLRYRNLGNDESDWSKAASLVLRDIIIGAGIGFAIFMFSNAMKTDAGSLFSAYVAGLAGTSALDQFLRAQGLKQERDQLVIEMSSETDLITELTQKLQAAEQELAERDELLTENQRRLRALTAEAKQTPLNQTGQQ